jgi:hypothetical protein
MDELDELRVMIAEKRGWTKVRMTKILGLRGHVPQHDWDDALPDWPRDIAAAWELVEEMRAARVVFNFTYIGYASRWYCELAGGRYAKGGDTAPEAISRAYLQWKESK